VAIVTGKSQRWRVLAAHAFLWALITDHALPAAGGGVAISLRPGNFATGSLIPSQISSSTGSWRWACPTSRKPTARVTQPPFPVLLWLWNSIKIATVSAC
jgi:maltose/maltodextrin transport system permease protein